MTVQPIEQVAAGDIAAHFHVSASAVHARLNGIPDEMASLYASPFGWTVLGEYVSAALGIRGAEPFAPTVH